ncbi:dihydrofolate reductase [Mortierella polycephala]|uniref:Dihydrofolate reductase n=1 Tax=Mortierella polycephala TaxID=41804 RepID=A0A9P6QAW9_9FUNG|nr:dihydrofolate reductase [Mortierella polycephala]
MRSFSIVVAADLASGIGLKGGLPWRLRKDMSFFAKITSKVVPINVDASKQDGIQKVNACIMGRRTWESIPAKFRPLASRFNVIVSRDPHYFDDKPEKTNPMVALATSLDVALDLVESHQQSPKTIASSDAIQIDRIFLIGGSQLYAEGVQSKHCANIFLTRIQATVECDTFFPEIKESDYRLLPSEEGHTFLETFMQEPVQGGVIEEGAYKFEYTVYNRV